MQMRITKWHNVYLVDWFYWKYFSLNYYIFQALFQFRMISILSIRYFRWQLMESLRRYKMHLKQTILASIIKYVLLCQTAPVHIGHHIKVHHNSFSRCNISKSSWSFPCTCYGCIFSFNNTVIWCIKQLLICQTIICQKKIKYSLWHAQAQPLVQSRVMLCLLASFQCFGSNNLCLVL